MSQIISSVLHSDRHIAEATINHQSGCTFGADKQDVRSNLAEPGKNGPSSSKAETITAGINFLKIV